jgi:hypothetical protein
MIGRNESMLRKKCLNIVCVSPAPWDFPIWTNRQNIMSRVAQAHNVLYVFHPVLLRSSIKRNLIRKMKPFSMIDRINDKLLIYTPYILPFSDEFMKIHTFNVKASALLLKRQLRRFGFKDYILWFYDPEAVDYLDHLSPKLACYDCVDEYSAMPYYSSPKRKMRLEKLERKLIEKCDLVFATSKNLYDQKIKLNPNTKLVENVGDFEHFNRVDREQLEVPSDFPSVSSPVLGFIGALDNYKVDFELIDYIAERKPDWAIVLIGSKMNVEEKNDLMPARENIYYLGMKRYEHLPNYISMFDVCIIPYRINAYTKNVFPLKFIEFMSTGKPLAMTPLPSIEKYAEFVRVGSSREEFLLAVEDAIRDDSEIMKKKRLDIARNNSWETRKDRLLSNIIGSLKEKIN